MHEIPIPWCDGLVVGLLLGSLFLLNLRALSKGKRINCEMELKKLNEEASKIEKRLNF